MNDDGDMLAVLPVQRGNAASRAVLWGLLAAGLTLLVVSVLRGLQFRPTGASNRLVDYSIAVLLLPIACFAAYAVVASSRLALLACWPAAVGVFATRDELILRFGPFGTKRFDVDRLEVCYPFEESEDAAEDGYEALLPEEVQLAQLCPRIAHPLAPHRLDIVIARRTGYTGQEIAGLLRPAIEYYRKTRAPRGES